jgi:hypothetical protein
LWSPDSSRKRTFTHTLPRLARVGNPSGRK